MKKSRYPRMTPRQKKMEPLINKALEVIDTECEQFVKTNNLEDKHFKIAGRVENAALDLPVKLSFYYIKYDDVVRVDFDIDYSEAKDLDVLKASLVKMFTPFLMGIEQAKKISEEANKLKEPQKLEEVKFTV